MCMQGQGFPVTFMSSLATVTYISYHYHRPHTNRHFSLHKNPVEAHPSFPKKPQRTTQILPRTGGGAGEGGSGILSPVGGTLLLKRMYV